MRQTSNMTVVARWRKELAVARERRRQTGLGGLLATRFMGRVALHLILVVAGFTFLVPLLWVLSTSLKRSSEVFIVPVQWIPRRPRWTNYQEIFTLFPMARFIANTAIVSVLGTLGSIFSALLVGYGLARLRWPGRETVFSVLLATMMLPGVVTMVPTFILFKYLHWLDTWLPLFVPSWFGGAFYIFLVRQFMAGLPIELDEAARMDGAGTFTIIWRIIAPLCGPVLATVGIFSFLSHYNDFMLPLIVLTTTERFTLAMGINWLNGTWGNYANWHLAMAASTVSLVTPVALFFIAQRYFIQGIQLSGLAGR